MMCKDTYECSPWTPPSTWAQRVLFSNFSSPEYIMALKTGIKTESATDAGVQPSVKSAALYIVEDGRTLIVSDSWPRYPGSHAGFHVCPWHPGPLLWRRGAIPSSLKGTSRRAGGLEHV
uniref:Uncharacterized protein n=1 Tax=Callorhinchus milii TaxID=7868 RepID=A0A4W3K9H2_CALMI